MRVIDKNANLVGASLKLKSSAILSEHFAKISYEAYNTFLCDPDEFMPFTWERVRSGDREHWMAIGKAIAEAHLKDLIG